MKYNKLVRDKIPEIIAANGKKAICRTLNDEEFKVYLEKKLDEEVAEFHESKNAEELADIISVIVQLACIYTTRAELADKIATKDKERGGFDKRILLIEVEE